jgi:hypothetical protein
VLGRDDWSKDAGLCRRIDYESLLWTVAREDDREAPLFNCLETLAQLC